MLEVKLQSAASPRRMSSFTYGEEDNNRMFHQLQLQRGDTGGAKTCSTNEH